MRRAWVAVCVAALLVGVGLAGEVLYQLWGTDIAADEAQQDAADVLVHQWSAPAPGPDVAELGTPIARLDIPRLGPGWTRILFEGVDQDTLAKGPGHYPGTAGPGQIGNFAIAGHRVGRGAPFDNAADLMPCDPIIVTTRSAVLTYRVLPFDDLPQPCTMPVDPGVPGREVVTPDTVSVIAPVPDAAAAPRWLLTITTCHPRFSARQRLVVHAILVDERDKSSA